MAKTGFAACKVEYTKPAWVCFGNAGRSSQLDFANVNRAALGVLPALLDRWLPDGRRQGAEWVARNPTRVDRRRGPFRVNTRTGRWADFATGARGGDVISLAAYLRGLRQAEAACKLADMLGLAS
jgi:hypothetical protein